MSTTFSHFQDLVLDIRNVASVDEALNLHFRKETLDTDNAYKCERCRKKVPATKRHLIERAPHVLLIQLKRLDRYGSWWLLLNYENSINHQNILMNLFYSI